MSKKDCIKTLIIINILLPTLAFCDDTVSVLKKVIYKVEQEYINGLSSKQLVMVAIKGIMEKLDDNSHYLTEEQFKKIRLSNKGKYRGIGIELERKKNGNILIKSVLKESPAEKQGLMKGDIILSINEKNNLSFLEITKEINSEGTILIEVLRGKKQLKYFLSSEVIATDMIEDKLLDNNILYIKINNFVQGTDIAVKEKIEKSLNEVYVKSIILDLRDNSGGIFNQAISFVEIFLPKETKITITQSKKNKHSYKSNNGNHINLPLVVLINNNTASAPEVIAGAFRDNKRAVIVGQKSFGKGSVQSVIPLKEGYGAIKITTAIYFTPNGHTIDGMGIKPDIEIFNTKQEDRQLSKAIDLATGYNTLNSNK
ncbi:MAG: PDZ domain-containing protein [Rickettsiaceae bacterium H1]|nr:PDZ domain-containing protein [Rickettsiaceae bacterium H1]